MNAYPLQSHEDIDTLISVWQMVLGDVDDHALQLAASEYLKSPNEWRPVPGKLRARALELGGCDNVSLAQQAWDKYGDISDEAMARDAKSDAIARDAIKAMKLKVRWHEDKPVEQFMAERERVFVETYARLMTRDQAFALPSGAAVAQIEAGEEA